LFTTEEKPQWVRTNIGISCSTNWTNEFLPKEGDTQAEDLPKDGILNVGEKHIFPQSKEWELFIK